jgi:hypothetical protein
VTVLKQKDLIETGKNGFNCFGEKISHIKTEETSMEQVWNVNLKYRRRETLKSFSSS